MGFLSKLFGGDAGAASGKTTDDPSSASAELESSVALRTPLETGDAAPPSADKSKDVPADNSVEKPSDRRSPGSRHNVPASADARPASSEFARVDTSKLDAPRSDVKKQDSPKSVAKDGSRANIPKVDAARADVPKAAPAKSEENVPAPASPGSVTETARAAVVTGFETAPGTALKSGSANAARSAERAPPSSVSRDDMSTAGVPVKAPQAPRRPAPLESSIITSAPALGAEAPRAPLAPRPSGASRAAKTASAEAGPAREKAPSPVADNGLVSGNRTRKDRSKSPGFYSNVAPEHAAHVVNPSASQSNLKRTVMGVAPPAAPLPGAVPLTPATEARPELATVANDVRTGASDGEVGAEGVEQAPFDDATTALPTTEADAAPPATSLAPAAGAGAEAEYKEETSPGLGQTRSRHDPASRRDLPEGELELLVDFVMDLGLGVADESWLEPVRSAVGRLKATAVKLQRNGLEKAVTQLGVELESPNALTEEKRSRIVQCLVLVDLALPRPIDVPGQRLVRERLILQHLLGELAAAFPRVAQHLRDEGMSSLERLGRLRAADLAESAGVSQDNAQEALSVFTNYLQERARRGPKLSLLGKRQVLEQHLCELEYSAEQFERVADDDDPGAKREARKRRQADIARLSLFLAERGETVILGEIERCPVQGKIARLRRWLTEQPPSSVRAPGVELPKQETTG
jgi:hypothetical protein